MKVRRWNHRNNQWEYGESRAFNTIGISEVIVYFGDTCDSEYIGNLQVKLGKCEYKSMEQAFKDKDIIPNNLNTEFDIPHSAIEKEQGYNFY